eukprot:COSAG04_NODE_267_length_18528_cov_60.607141_1_plen_52_part_10
MIFAEVVKPGFQAARRQLSSADGAVRRGLTAPAAGAAASHSEPTLALASTWS